MSNKSDNVAAVEAPKTLDQHAVELDAWLKERGLVPVVVARGRVSGGLSPIADFMPETHDAVFTLQPSRP